MALELVQAVALGLALDEVQALGLGRLLALALEVVPALERASIGTGTGAGFG